MASTGLSGPFNLDGDTIDNVVTKTSAGAYALGKVGSNGSFLISYVGRADVDLAARLRSHVGKHSKFKAGYLPSPKAAFDKECHLYHDFDPPGNVVHPARSKGSNWTCPRCTVFD